MNSSELPQVGRITEVADAQRGEVRFPHKVADSGASRSLTASSDTGRQYADPHATAQDRRLAGRRLKDDRRSAVPQSSAPRLNVSQT